MNAADLSAILTRRSGSNFYYSFLFLPKRKRHAIYALYAFCRTVDDTVDQGAASPSEQRRILAVVERDSVEPRPDPDDLARGADLVELCRLVAGHPAGQDLGLPQAYG